MAIGNSKPIYSGLPSVQWIPSPLTTANTAVDGTGTVATGWTAPATYGGRIDRVKIRALGTNVATVIRFFINNGSTNATAANNSLYFEVTLPATAASATLATADQEIALDLPMPGGYKLNFTIGTTVTAGYQVTVVGGDYTP